MNLSPKTRRDNVMWIGAKPEFGLTGDYIRHVHVFVALLVMVRKFVIVAITDVRSLLSFGVLERRGSC